LANKSARALLAGWAGVVVNLGQPLLVLPVALVVLPQGEFATWLFIHSLLLFGMLAESGFSSSLTRAFSVAGAATASFDRDRVGEVADRVLVPLAILGGGITLLGAVLFLPNLFERTVVPEELNRLTIVSLVVMTVIQIAGLRFVVELNGTGSIHVAKFVEAGGASLRVLAGAGALLAGGSYWGVACALALVQGVQFATLFVATRARRNIVPDRRGTRVEVMDYVWPATWRTAGMNGGAFLVVNGASFMATLLDDIAATTSLLFSLRVALLLKQVALMPVQISAPRIAWSLRDEQGAQARATFVSAASLGLLVYLVGAVFLLTFGARAVALLTAESTLLMTPLLALLLFTHLLEVNHTLHATFYVQTNHVPFLLPSLATGALYLGLAALLGPRLDVLGILVALFLSQLVLSNWLPLYFSRRLLPDGLGATYRAIFRGWLRPGPLGLLRGL
jgi:hypothetical protein